jgi:hypothetical protein
LGQVQENSSRADPEVAAAWSIRQDIMSAYAIEAVNLPIETNRRSCGYKGSARGSTTLRRARVETSHLSGLSKADSAKSNTAAGDTTSCLLSP